MRGRLVWQRGLFVRDRCAQSAIAVLGGARRGKMKLRGNQNSLFIFYFLTVGTVWRILETPDAVFPTLCLSSWCFRRAFSTHDPISPFLYVLSFHHLYKYSFERRNFFSVQFFFLSLPLLNSHFYPAFFFFFNDLWLFGITGKIVLLNSIFALAK